MTHSTPASHVHSPEALSKPQRLPPARVRTRSQPNAEPFPAITQSPKPVITTPTGYEVGYGKPPKHTRYKPGQSGNPKGRPKAAKGLHTLVRENLTQKVSVRTPAGEKKISRIEAVLHKAVEQAMKGNPRAIAELLKLYGNAVPEQNAEAAVGDGHENDLTASDLAILSALREDLVQELEASHEDK